MNNIAQLAEAAHVVEPAMEIIDMLLTKGIKPETVKVTPKAGRGYAGD